MKSSVLLEEENTNVRESMHCIHVFTSPIFGKHSSKILIASSRKAVIVKTLKTIKYPNENISIATKTY